MSNKLITLENISKSYDNHLVLDEMNLYIRENEFVTLLGPSGCGKTTTLRIIGGFENPDTGRVVFDGKISPSCQLIKDSLIPYFRNMLFLRI